MTIYDDYYQFKESDLDRFAQAIGAKVKKKNGNMQFMFCPYCHGGKNHDTETFGVSLTDGQFKCQRASCGITGNMIVLAKDFSNKFDLGRDVSNYYNIGGRKETFKKFKDARRKIETRPPAIEYLTGRGISEEIIKKYEITAMPDNDKVLVFPFKDEDGALQFIKYRNLDPDAKSKEWAERNCKKILFGMNHCEDFSTLVITEGQIDSLSCAEAGIKNAVSVPLGKNGFTWKPIVWNWLVKFEEIVVFGDCENGEITLAKEIASFFPKKVRIVRQADYKGCKDANELLQRCGKEALIKAVENAEVKVSLRIKNLAEVEQVDLSKMTSFPTGFPTLDRMIGNGFHEGEVIILTGKCGEGKSTFASMIVAKMLENNLKVFAYSGELPDYMFKAWLDYQIGGSKELTEAKRNGISEWYNKKIFIYDNSALIDEKEELFDVMGQAVKYLGCKFILIDNLMTAMEDKSQEDLFRQQSKFLNRLTKFAKGFNVTILLIAHPKKGVGYDNDTIAGSGDITNRANLVIRFQRKSQRREDNNKSLLLVTKNRTTGELDFEGINMDYHPESMRITEHGEPEHEFMHDIEGGFDVIEDLDSIPF